MQRELKGRAVNLTLEQIEAVKKGEVVKLPLPEVGGEVVLLRAETYEEMRETLEDDREKAAWAALGRKAVDLWARENPF
jgi:hypothetical protein